MAAEKAAKSLENQLNELSAKLDESNRNIAELNNQRSRSSSEAADLAQQLEDAESQIAQLNRAKQQLAAQLDEAKRALEDESRVRNKHDFFMNNKLTKIKLYRG